MQKIYYTLTEKLAAVVKKSPDKIALQLKKSEGYEQYTYQDLYNKAKAIARSLTTLGIKKNGRAAIILENRPEWVFIYFGILLAGIIAVPLDPQATLDDLEYFFQDSESKIVFTSVKFKSLACTVAQTSKTLQHIVLLDGDELETATGQILFFSEFLNNSSETLEYPKNLPSDIASILYTSGTTGKPKGVMLTHENFYANFRSIEKTKIFPVGNNVLSILPLHHSFPFMTTLIIPIFSQNKITYISGLKQEEITRCMRETNVTCLVGVPQFFYLVYQAILNEINDLPIFIRTPLLGLVNLCYKLRQLTTINLNKFLLTKVHRVFGRQLKYFVSGGAKLDKDIEIFLTKIGFTIIQGYGLTETAPIVTFNPINRIKIGSVGTAIPDVDIKIMEPEASGVGEVAIRGPNLMRGYYKRQAATQEVLKDSWFYSGDLGYLDQQGYLFLTGRKKELIILGTGKNISPEEIEAHYLQSRYIKELCVLPVGTGAKEKLAAVIVPDFEKFKTSGEINIRNKIKIELEIFSQNYPLYKCIMGFVISKEELPKTQLGKIKRHEVRNKYLDELMGVKPKVQQEEISEADREIIASPTYRIIAAVIEKQFNLPIQLNDHLAIDLGFDSLSRIELIAALEKLYNLEVPEPLIAKVSTIKELTLTFDRLIITQASKTTLPITTPVKATLWQNILKNGPKKTVTDKIDLAPNRFAKTVNILFYSGLYIIAKLMWRIKIYGTANLLPQNGPFILCPNHTSYLDGLLIGISLPKWLQVKVFFLSDNIYFAAPIVRNFVKIGKVIPLDPAANLIDTLQACAYVLKHGKPICVFPEGGRSIDGSIQPFKKGVGILAQELNVPLLPVYIDGAFKVLPRGRFFPSFNSIKIIFGKPYSPDQLKEKGMSCGVKDSYEAIARGIQNEVNSLAPRRSI